MTPRDPHGLQNNIKILGPVFRSVEVYHQIKNIRNITKLRILRKHQIKNTIKEDFVSVILILFLEYNHMIKVSFFNNVVQMARGNYYIFGDDSLLTWRCFEVNNEVYGTINNY